MKFAIVLLLCPIVWGMPQQDEQQQQQQQQDLAAEPQQQLGSASCTFFQNLYPELVQDDSSRIFSPLSIHMVLSLLTNGAEEETKAQLLSTLQLDNDNLRNHYQDIYQKLIRNYNGLQDLVIQLANGLFIQQNAQIKQDYLTLAQTKYEAKVENIDMNANGGPEQPINDFIANRTHDLIQGALPAGKITDDTRLLLLNTVYFNGSWEEPFQKAQPKEFYKLDGTTAQVPMMRDNRLVQYKDDKNFQAQVIRLRFKDNRFALYIALPKENKGLTKLEEKLRESPGQLRQLLSNLADTHVDVQIPKFKIESKADLKAPLQKIGIQDAFDDRKANLRGITGDPIFVNSADHQALIDVDENGTVGAAVTTIGTSVTSERPDADAVFKADHPFLFVVLDDETGQTIFQGRYNN